MKAAAANTAPPERVKKPELSWLNLMFCFMVLWSHSSGYALANLEKTSWQYALAFSLQRICFTSVYGFLFLSGLKLTLSRKAPPPLLSFWAKRAKAILLPYCLAVAIYYYYYAVILRHSRFDPATYLGFLLLGNSNSHFYFIVILVQFILLTPLMRWLSERCPPALILPGAVIITLLGGVYFNDILAIFFPGARFLYRDRIFTNYLVYYLAGCCIGRRYERFLVILEENKKLIVGVSVCAISFDLVLSWFGYAMRRRLTFMGPVLMLHFLCAILLCFLIAVRLPKELPKWLVSIDRAGLLIYLYHMLVLKFIDQILESNGITKVSVHFILRALFVYTITPLGCVLWQRLWGTIKKRRSP